MHNRLEGSHLLERIVLQPGPQVSELLKPPADPAALREGWRDLRRANEQLRQLYASLLSRNEELSAYAHTVAHALKNPLSVLVVIASAMEHVTDLSPAELQEYCTQITTTAYEMNSIVDDLLFLAEVSQVDRPAAPLDMAGVVARACRRLDGMIREYRGRISAPQTWPAALGYAAWIEEVWMNYISNALKYGGPSPHIELGADTLPDGMLRFWTRDDGPGIPPRKQAHLFTPFTRIGQFQRPGNGLGLSIVRRIVEKSGGQAGVESAAGRGSLFFFTLPPAPSLSPKIGLENVEESRRSVRALQ